MTAPAMPPEAAAWIRAHAWNDDMRDMDDSYPNGRGSFIYRISPCQMGRCGACDMGRCDQCVTVTRDGDPFGWDVSVSLGGRVVAHLAPVDGQRCAGWVCTCRHAEPATVPPFTDKRAAWIREHVLPPAIREYALIGCPCQWGPTRCGNGDHDECRAARPIVYPAGWVTWSNGHVCTPAPADDVQVWRTGRPCAMRCTCDCHTALAALVPGPLVQDALFPIGATT